MRWGAWGALVVIVGLAPVARADVYRYRDASGALVFTNAPAERASRVVLQEPPAAPAARRLLMRRLADIFPQPLPLGAPTSYDGLIREIAARYNVEYALVKAIIKAESGF